jgi:outer membrane protein
MAFLLLAPSLAQSRAEQQPAANAPGASSTVTLNFTAVVMHTAEAQREFAALEKKFAPRRARVQSLNDEVDSLRRQVTDGEAKPGDSQQAARTQSLQAKEKELQRAAEDLRNDSQTESQETFQRIAQKVYAFLQTYADQQRYSLVIERGNDASPVVWYAAAGRDITEQAAKAYDAQASSPAAPVPTAPAPRKP